ncbi:MAG: UDP-3-O-(3-hydroxymyristoyl)glucosamine N-acyltransferase [Gemmatimonadota bacterium]
MRLDPARGRSPQGIERGTGSDTGREEALSALPSVSLTAQAVADLVGGRLSGPGDVALRRCRSLETAEPDALAMATGGRWAAALAATHAGAVLVPAALEGGPGPATRIIVRDPARAMVVAAGFLHPEPGLGPHVATTVRFGAGTVPPVDASIGAYVVLGAGVVLGARVRLGAHVVIEDGVVLGDDVRLDAHVVVHHGSRLGDRVWCKAGAVIGGAGFGFVSDAAGHTRVPQVGGCILEDDVQVGSCSCIDRGSLDDTVIGQGSKLDNHVHVGHNVRMGHNCLLMAGVGVSGSTVLGHRVVMAGQSGVAGHLTLGDDVKVGAKSAVISSVEAGMSVSGYPARPHREFLKALAALYRLAPHHDALERLAAERRDA